MSTQPKSQEEAKDRLWDEIRKVRYGMLGLVGADSGGHFQPMTAFCEPETGDIWYFTRKDTDLARAAAGGADAMFVIQARDQGFQACLSGRIQPQHDAARIERYWNAVVAAWFPDGRDDPQLTLLLFQPKDAQVWLSESNPIKFFWEIAKANMSKGEPDVGQSTSLHLSGGRA